MEVILYEVVSELDVLFGRGDGGGEVQQALLKALVWLQQQARNLLLHCRLL